MQWRSSVIANPINTLIWLHIINVSTKKMCINFIHVSGSYLSQMFHQIKSRSDEINSLLWIWIITVHIQYFHLFHFMIRYIHCIQRSMSMSLWLKAQYFFKSNGSKFVFTQIWWDIFRMLFGWFIFVRIGMCMIQNWGASDEKYEIFFDQIYWKIMIQILQYKLLWYNANRLR